jgi:hypothetical protein
VVEIQGQGADDGAADGDDHRDDGDEELKWRS